jgi:Ras-related protein Rab-1A
MLDIDKYKIILFRFAKDGVLRFLVGNKCDLSHKRQVSYEQGKELAAQYNIPFIETSAKDVVNIEELFLNCTKCFIENQLTSKTNKDAKKDRNVKNKGITIENIAETIPKKKGCC